MEFPNYFYVLFVLAVLPYAVREVSALNYASVDSGDGQFKLHWAYSGSKLIFNMTCKGSGWCGVAFTTTNTGAGMVDYDIAVGGVDMGTKYVHVSLTCTTEIVYRFMLHLK